MVQLLNLPSPYYALLGIALYLVALLLKKRSFVAPDLTTLIFVVLDSLGVVAGINVIRASCTVAQYSGMQNQELYLFIGGLTVLLVSCRDLWSKYREI